VSPIRRLFPLLPLLLLLLLLLLVLLVLLILLLLLVLLLLLLHLLLLRGKSANTPEAPQSKAEFSNQPSLVNPLFLMKRHRSLTVAVHKSFASMISSPKTL
jgi:hypothetical protein